MKKKTQPFLSNAPEAHRMHVHVDGLKICDPRPDVGSRTRPLSARQGGRLGRPQPRPTSARARGRRRLIAARALPRRRACLPVNERCEGSCFNLSQVITQIERQSWFCVEVVGRRCAGRRCARTADRHGALQAGGTPGGGQQAGVRKQWLVRDRLCRTRAVQHRWRGKRASPAPDDLRRRH